LRWNSAVATLAASWGLIAVIVREVDLDAQVLVFYRLRFASLTLGIVAIALRKLPLLRLERHRGRIGITRRRSGSSPTSIRLGSAPWRRPSKRPSEPAEPERRRTATSRWSSCA
jgi:hypothetical protein